jgi:hypothetical protein
MASVERTKDRIESSIENGGTYVRLFNISTEDKIVRAIRSSESSRDIYGLTHSAEHYYLIGRSVLRRSSFDVVLSATHGKNEREKNGFTEYNYAGIFLVPDVDLFSLTSKLYSTVLTQRWAESIAMRSSVSYSIGHDNTLEEQVNGKMDKELSEVIHLLRRDAFYIIPPVYQIGPAPSHPNVMAI